MEVSKFTSYAFGLWVVEPTSQKMCAFYISLECILTVYPLPSCVFILAYSNEYFILACRCRKKAYSQERCVHAKELQGAGIHAKESHAAASHSHSVPSQGNLDCALMDDEGIFVDGDAISVDIGPCANANAQEATRKNQSEELKVEPIYYADTAAKTPVDSNTDVKLTIVYDKENPRIRVNEYFPTMEDLRMAVRQHGINKGFQVHKVKTDKTRYRAECKATGCPWRIVARKLQGLPAVVVLV